MKYEGENNYVRMNMAKKKREICGKDNCVRVEEGMRGEICKIIFLLIDKVFFKKIIWIKNSHVIYSVVTLSCVLIIVFYFCVCIVIWF